PSPSRARLVGRLTAIARAVEVNSPYLIRIKYLASLLSQRNQKQNHADRRQDDGNRKTRGRDLSAEMIIFFERPSKAYQEGKNANAKQNQPDRSLVIGGDFHGCRNPI